VDVPAARRVSRPTWINARTVLGAILFALAFVGGRQVLSGAGATTSVLVATRDLARGDVIHGSDLRLVGADLPPDILATYATSIRDLEGAVATRAIHSGELLSLEWFSGAGDPVGQGRSMTVPVSPDHAVGGDLRPGDVVDVYATFDAGDVRARTSLLVREAEILHIVSSEGVIIGDQGMVGVTLSVSPDEAGRLAFAIRTSELDLVRVDVPELDAASGTVTREDV
jgi:Flp pilus assembly protein CpaB